MITQSLNFALTETDVFRTLTPGYEDMYNQLYITLRAV